ncbi:exodeoxyribonuclease VII small subunit [Halobacteriales archaeon SW_10_68_16]|jgi:exodeoxyribonuclease VII small subunit|nr:MAG: exodeoxyribonuclease VII small subunit [Halobacteriales archaeon SW_10_68_16]
MTEETTISEKVDRVETIIETLEDGDVSLERAQELHAEGQALLEELQADLDVGSGEILDQ